MVYNDPRLTGTERDTEREVRRTGSMQEKCDRLDEIELKDE